MANAEHLEILKRGVKVWNQWREERNITPDLRDAQLRGLNLSFVDFSQALLEGADLAETILVEGFFKKASLVKCDLSFSSLLDAVFQDACLDDAILEYASLDRADFRGAQIWEGDFQGASLTEADFTRAYLVGSNFRESVFFRTSLEGADIEGVSMGKTIIADVDLCAVRHLERVFHGTASSISIDTIERSASGASYDSIKQAQLETFFRGAGLPEEHIEFFRARIGSPIRFYTCFISYSHMDKALARRLHDQLQACGIRCWLDEHDLKPGDRILDVVNDAIRLHDKILLCCSEASLESWWVKDEIRKAQERERCDSRDIIIPLMVDRYLLEGWEDGLAADLRSRLAADFTGWEHDNARFEEQFERVVKALRADDEATN